MHKFKRYFEFAVSDADDSISGIAIDYVDVYELGRSRMQFAPGSLVNIGAADVILNMQHDRGRPMCRTGGGLELMEADNKVFAKCELPPTQDGNDAHTLIARGLLRSFSLEVNIDDYDDAGAYCDGLHEFDVCASSAVSGLSLSHT